MRAGKILIVVFSLVLAPVFALSGCHAVPECVGQCDTDEGDGETDAGPDAADGADVAVDDAGDGPPPDVVEERADADEDAQEDVSTDGTADGPEGCIPCENLFPNCEEGKTCCADPMGKEMCNGLDDDCDWEVDEDINFEEDPRNCGACGNDCRLPHAEVRCNGGECEFIRCLTYYRDCLEDDPEAPGTLGCEYYCAPSAGDDTICDRLDNDCDCLVDEDIDLTTDIDNCGSCGTRCRFPHAAAECFSPDGTAASAVCRLGACHEGYWNDDGEADNGCEYACTPCEHTQGACVSGRTCCTVDGDELCNSLDDECDGDVDDGNPGGGGVCGSDVGECATGTQVCVDGSLRCSGETGPVRETCDGADNDCDCTGGDTNGDTVVCGPGDENVDEPDEGDEKLPDEGFPCGETLGDCESGETICVDGDIACLGGTGPEDEACDGHDNDCDDSVDELPIEGAGDACGTDAGECVAGTRQCVSGGWTCSGETGPTPEICDGKDNDCNGVDDDPFDKDNDPNNCGACDFKCSDIMGDHVIYICDEGTCTKLGCDEGYWDIDADPNTCEYPCDYTGGEICDGADNDCDGDVDGADDGMADIENFCYQLGACNGSEPQCAAHGGITKWYCSYGADVSLDTDFETILPEGDCDEIDNDCDGFEDEAFPDKGDDCDAGIGTCNRPGHVVCNDSDDGVICDAVPGDPGVEICNGLDDNCDRTVDNFNEDDWTAIGAVAVSGSGAQYVLQYEASRPNAAACDRGTHDGTGTALTTKACSKAGVQPWTDVDWTTAREACCNLNDDGQCHLSGADPDRWSLCREQEWEEICESGGHNYFYPYGMTYQAAYCNGNDFDTNCPCPELNPECATGGDQDEIMPTAKNPELLNCCADWDGVCVYDMSGNVKEWTYTQRGSGYREIRGGSNNVPRGGLTCQFDFAIGRETFTFYNLGFRCCYY